jgi:hypothetical protein
MHLSESFLRGSDDDDHGKAGSEGAASLPTLHRHASVIDEALQEEIRGPWAGFQPQEDSTFARIDADGTRATIRVSDADELEDGSAYDSVLSDDGRSPLRRQLSSHDRESLA